MNWLVKSQSDKCGLNINIFRFPQGKTIKHKNSPQLNLFIHFSIYPKLSNPSIQFNLIYKINEQAQHICYSSRNLLLFDS